MALRVFENQLAFEMIQKELDTGKEDWAEAAEELGRKAF